MTSEIKIGILVPQSKQYKTLDRDFIRGIKLNDLPVKYYIESIGLGADDQLIVDKIQKLHHQEEINIIIGFFGHHNISRVYEYAAANDILLIASDLGATLPYSLGKFTGVYINSFGLNESSYLLGSYFNTKDYRNICSSSSYYDAGYGILAAIETSFKKNNISFSGHYVTPFYPREDEVQQMQQAIDANNTQVVFAIHSGLYAEEHGEFISETSLLKKYPYYTTPFSFNEKMLSINIVDTVFIVSSWLKNDSKTDTCNFTEKYERSYDDAPSIFALLGYENGLIIKTILKMGSFNTSQKVLIAEMTKLKVNGPRGNIQFDLDTNRTSFNHFIFKVVHDDENNFYFEKTDTLENDGCFIKAITKENTPPKIGGWQNAYLCH